MLKQRLLLSALAFVGLIAVSAVAQNPGDPANIANIPNIMDNQKCPCEMDNQKCPLCECVSTSARGPCSKWWKWSPNQVSSPEWYQNGHFDPAKRTKELSKQLKLTADQQSQMLDTLESTKSQLEAVRSDRSLSRKVRNCKLALIRQASNDQISAFLEKKQDATLVRIRAAYGARSSAALW
jgi:predicted GIY-YIG superfamily endonuclease